MQKWFWITMGLVLLLWFASFGLVYAKFGGHQLQSYGVFGDSFGAVNALFSGLAFVGVVFALLLQQQGQKDSEREHKERMELEKQVLEAQKAAAEAQRKTAEQQEAIAKAQKELIEAQIGASQALHATVQQQKALSTIQIIQAQVAARAALIAAKRSEVEFQPALGHTDREAFIGHMRHYTSQLDELFKKLEEWEKKGSDKAKA